jgi:hypothetical protein
MQKKKFFIISIITLAIVFAFFHSSFVHALTPKSETGIMTTFGNGDKTTDSLSPISGVRYCDNGMYDVCVNPGSSFPATGTITFYPGLGNGLPAIGIGTPGLGYFRSTDPVASCSASGGTSTGTGYCENSVANPAGGTATVSFTVNIKPDAPAGYIFPVGITANGFISQEKDFRVQISHPPTCVINSFTCSSGVLSWATQSCSPLYLATPQNPNIGTLATLMSVSTGTLGSSTVPASPGTYTLQGTNGITTDTAISTVTCAAVANPPKLEIAPIVSPIGTPGRPLTIPFSFSNTGGGGVLVDTCLIDTDLSYTRNCPRTLLGHN